MEAYSKSITVQEDDLDDLDHVNNVRYVQWIQDISKEHWLSVVTPELRKNVVWVVRNHKITKALRSWAIPSISRPISPKPGAPSPPGW